MLDNDEAGRKPPKAIGRNTNGVYVITSTPASADHNDLNDYLRSLKVKQSQERTAAGEKPQPGAG